jgi:serine phosphatase RsbU (regulator of sigma subunit)
MTTIEKIKQSNQVVEDLFNQLGALVRTKSTIRILDVEILQKAVGDLAYAQAEALRQATEVADENFARAQKLSEQVQENVRHIERLAERRSDEDRRIIQGLEKIAIRIDSFVEAERDMPLESLRICQDKLIIALALAKGEAV